MSIDTLYKNTIEDIDKESAKVKSPHKQKKKEESWKFISWKNKKYNKFELTDEDKLYQIIRKQKKSKNKIQTKKWSFYKSQRLFLNWLESNIDSFNTKPILQPTRVYTFENIVDNVSMQFQDYINDPEIRFTYKDELFDLYSPEYIGCESYHPQKGYYDADRVDGKYTYYKTKEELFEKEVFDYLLKYLNENITPNHSLYLVDCNGSSHASIGITNEDDLENRIKRYVTNECIDNLSIEECEDLLKNDEVYKIIKYELFETNKDPLIRYMRYKNKGNR